MMENPLRTRSKAYCGKYESPLGNFNSPQKNQQHRRSTKKKNSGNISTNVKNPIRIMTSNSSSKHTVVPKYNLSQFSLASDVPDNKRAHSRSPPKNQPNRSFTQKKRKTPKKRTKIDNRKIIHQLNLMTTLEPDMSDWSVEQPSVESRNTSFTLPKRTSLDGWSEADDSVMIIPSNILPTNTTIPEYSGIEKENVERTENQENKNESPNILSSPQKKLVHDDCHGSFSLETSKNPSTNSCEANIGSPPRKQLKVRNESFLFGKSENPLKSSCDQTIIILDDTCVETEKSENPSDLGQSVIVIDDDECNEKHQEKTANTEIDATVICISDDEETTSKIKTPVQQQKSTQIQKNSLKMAQSVARQQRKMQVKEEARKRKRTEQLKKRMQMIKKARKNKNRKNSSSSKQMKKSQKNNTNVKSVVKQNDEKNNSHTTNAGSIGENDSRPLREIIIDGCNIAMSFTKDRSFSEKGIQIIMDYFRKRGHTVKVFLPNCYRSQGRPFLEKMFKEGSAIFTPSRMVGHKRITPYDDNYILQYATQCKGIVVSLDQYRDIYQSTPEFRETIEKRLLPPTFVGDLVMFPVDPLGRGGPTLDEFLRLW